MRGTLGQIAFFAVISLVLGLGRNVVAPGGVPWIGIWGAVVTAAPGDSTGAPRPASAQPDDPPFLTIDQAQAMHADPSVIFVDARYPEDYRQGHIKGAILLPFEMFDDYWAGVEPRLPRGRRIVTYCGGEECEMSLFLARLLRTKGYNNLSIFYGGATLWKQHNLPMDTTAAPPPGA